MDDDLWLILRSFIDCKRFLCDFSYICVVVYKTSIDTEHCMNVILICSGLRTGINHGADRKDKFPRIWDGVILNYLLTYLLNANFSLFIMLQYFKHQIACFTMQETVLYCLCCRSPITQLSQARPNINHMFLARAQTKLPLRIHQNIPFWWKKIFYRVTPC